jgi:hypothetical protein
MTWIIDTKSKRHLSAKLAAGLVISAMLGLGTFAGSASAQEYRGGYSGYYYHNWNGGYYRAPAGGLWLAIWLVILWHPILWHPILLSPAGNLRPWHKPKPAGY